MNLGTAKLKISWAILLSAGLALIGCEREGGGHDDGHAAGHLYVLNQTSRTIYVYNDTNLIAKEDSFSSVIPEPHWMEYAPDGKYYYIVSRFSPGQIAKFDAATNLLVDSVTMGGSVFPTSLAITANSAVGYLCDFNYPSLTPGRIHKYNLNTMTFMDSSISNGAASHDLMITADGKMLVACSRNTDDVTLVYLPQDTVHIIPLDSNNIRPNPPVYEPYGVHIDHNDSLAYITCLKNGLVKIVDLYTRQVIDSIIIAPTAGCGYAPNGPTLSALSHDDTKIYVTTQCGNSLVIASTVTRTVLNVIPFSIDRPFGVRLNHDGTRVYVACANVQNQPGRIYVIDGVNLTKIDSIDVGLNSYGLFWHEH